MVWYFSWFEVRVLFGSRLGRGGGCRGKGAQRSRWPAVLVLIRPTVSIARSPAVLSVWQRHYSQRARARWKQSISKWDHLRHLNNRTLRHSINILSLHCLWKTNEMALLILFATRGARRQHEDMVCMRCLSGNATGYWTFNKVFASRGWNKVSVSSNGL